MVLLTLTCEKFGGVSHFRDQTASFANMWMLCFPLQNNPTMPPHCWRHAVSHMHHCHLCKCIFSVREPTLALTASRTYHITACYLTTKCIIYIYKLDHFILPEEVMQAGFQRQFCLIPFNTLVTPCFLPFACPFIQGVSERFGHKPKEQIILVWISAPGAKNLGYKKRTLLNIWASHETLTNVTNLYRLFPLIENNAAVSWLPNFTQKVKVSLQHFLTYLLCR